jgi:hydroxypyruvate reductase
VILGAAIDAVHAGRLVERALGGGLAEELRRAPAVDVIAAGKASAAMLGAYASTADIEARTMVAIGPRQDGSPVLPAGAEWWGAGHPLPDEGSVGGARRALEIARCMREDDVLLVLLSGGGSSLMALPGPGLSLAAKQRTAQVLMAQSADIYELNTVRKHLSAIKGGQLAAAACGAVTTLAVSDVVGDDLSVIASGPTVPDDSTFRAALDVLVRRGGLDRYPSEVVDRLRRGIAGEIAETPKTGDGRLARAAARVIGPQRGAIEGARRAAEARGYHVHVVAEPVTGEARLAAQAHVRRAAEVLATLPRPACVLSSGETTVTVVGTGKGGRNQEFALAMVRPLAALGGPVIVASLGTDGIDGPTDAAGAIVDPSSLARSEHAALAPVERYLENNDAYTFFGGLGDLIHTGPTSTNVGDIQVVLAGNE